MSALFHEVFFRPIFNLMVWLYDVIPGNDLGLAIVGVTILIKLVLFPLSQQALKSQRAMQALQPKLEELKKKYKDQKEKLAQEMMKLYKEQKVNPLSSCFPLFIQLPFLWAVFRVFRQGLNQEVGPLLYSFVANPGILNTTSLGVIDLTHPAPILGVLAGIGQFIQTKMLSTKRPTIKSEGAKDENMMAMVNKQMTFMMPVITVVFGFTFPAGLMLYWFITTLLTIVQQYFLFKPARARGNTEKSPPV